MRDFPFFYVVGIPLILAALFYVCLKWVNWRDRKRWRGMARQWNANRSADGRSTFRTLAILALCLPLSGCGGMTPEERAAFTKFALDSAALARDKALAPKTAKVGKMKSTGKEPAPVFPPKGTERLFE